MDRSSEQENPDQMPTESLDIVVADVASALVQAIGRSRPGSKGIHRSLRTSLVTLMVDLKSANTIQALASRKPLQRCLQQIAESLNGILRDDYVRREYPNSLARPSIQPSSPFLPRILAFLVNKTAVPSPSDAVERWILHPLPILGMFHEIVSSSETWQVQLDDFLTQDERLFVQLNALIKDWNSLVDQLYDSGHLDDDSDDKNYPMPPKLQAGISTEESVHHLSQSLYNILHGTWPCHSDEHDHNGRLGCCVQARFCLDPQWSSKDRKNDSFFVLLTGPDILQECRVCPKNRGVKAQAPACLINYDDHSRGVCLYLETDSNNQLWDKQRSAQPLEIILEEDKYAEMSLSELLTTVKPTYATKRVIGVTLARCILHLFEGPWLSECMSVNDIYFYYKMQNDLPNPLFDKVFIGTEFGTESDQPRSTGYKVHPFPTILALGIVLIELELGEDLADIQDEHSFASIKHKPYYVAQYLLKEVMKRFNLDSGLLRAAKFCIDRASFAHFEPLSTDTLLLNQDFVDTYYNSIVRPLEQDLVKGAFWTWEQVDQLTPPSLVQTGICKVFTKNPVRKRHGETLGFNTRRVLNGDQTAVAMSSLKESKDVILQSLKSSAHLHPAIGRTKTSEKPRSKLSECENAQSQPAHGGKQIISEGCSLSTEPERLPVTKKNRHSRPRSRDDFEVAIICALPREASAVHAHFEKHWEDDGGIYTYGKQHNDKNSYSVGSIGGHNVVLAHQERMGPVPAAKVATMCSMSFTNIKLALVVGICGGVPSPTPNEEILLGDVVISKGIVHYTFGRQDSDQFRRKATVEDQPGRPSGEILSLLVRLETDMHRRTLQTTIAGYLDDLDYGAHGTTKICYPGNGQDKLFEAKYCHRHQDESTICPTCVDGICDIARKSGCEKLKCDQQRLVRRSRQNQKNRPLVHFGLIASGETVLKSGIKREAIADEAKVIAFEMEGAGVWDSIPCVVIKGVCDYADSHKNKIWQDYAAMTAAASAKAFLQHWPTNTTLESEGLH